MRKYYDPYYEYDFEVTYGRREPLSEDKIAPFRHEHECFEWFDRFSVCFHQRFAVGKVPISKKNMEILLDPLGSDMANYNDVSDSMKKVIAEAMGYLKEVSDKLIAYPEYYLFDERSFRGTGIELLAEAQDKVFYAYKKLDRNHWKEVIPKELLDDEG